MKGLAVMNVRAGAFAQVRERTRDVAILHNEQFFAAAQKKYTYIYDKRGLEVHCLKVGKVHMLCRWCGVHC